MARVMIDDGVAAGLFTNLLIRGLANIDPADGRAEAVSVVAFGEQPATAAPRTATIDSYRLVHTPRGQQLGNQDRATLGVTIVCVADAGTLGSSHAVAEVASLVRLALDGAGDQLDSHTVEVVSIDRQYARPDADQELTVCVLEVTAVVYRDEKANIANQPNGGV